MGRRGVRLVALGLAGLFLGACGSEVDQQGRSERNRSSGRALAQVNEAELQEPELDRLIPSDLREGVSGAEIASILERWVSTELLYQKAREEGLERDPEVAERLYELQRQLLADEYLQRQLKSRVEVSNEEIRAYYDEHIDRFTEELQIRQIVLSSEDEAYEVLEKLKAGAAFRTLARDHSIDATASKGGDLGFLGKGAMNPAFESIVFDMQPNEVRGPIASTFGFHVVQLVARRKAARPVTFEAARDEILQALLFEKQQQAHAELLAELRAQASVSVAHSYAGMSLQQEHASPRPPILDDIDEDIPADSVEAEAPEGD